MEGGLEAKIHEGGKQCISHVVLSVCTSSLTTLLYALSVGSCVLPVSCHVAPRPRHLDYLLVGLRSHRGARDGWLHCCAPSSADTLLDTRQTYMGHSLEMVCLGTRRHAGTPFVLSFTWHSRRGVGVLRGPRRRFLVTPVSPTPCVHHCIDGSRRSRNGKPAGSPMQRGTLGTLAEPDSDTALPPCAKFAYTGLSILSSNTGGIGPNAAGTKWLRQD